MNKNLIFYISNASQLGLRFIQMIVITRYLSKVDLGVYYASAAYPQLLSRIFDLGLPHAVRYYILQVPSAARFIVKLVLIFSLFISLPIMIIFYFIEKLPLESGEISFILSDNFVVLGFYCVFLIVNSIFYCIVISFEKYNAVLLTSTLPYLIFIVAIMIQFNIFHLEVGDILFQFLVSEMVAFLIYSIFIAKIITNNNAHTVQLSLRSLDVFKYALQVYPSGFLKIMTTRLDKVILSFIAAPVFIGYYSVLMTIRDISIFPITSYGQVFMNNLSMAFKMKGQGIQKKIDKSILGILILYSAGFVVFLFVQDIVLKLFFKEITNDTYRAAFFLLLSAIPLALLSFLSTIFLITNSPKHVSFASIIGIGTFYGFVSLFYGWLGSDSFFYASVLSVLAEFIYLFVNYRVLLSKKML